nr:Ankyrin repeat family protein, putative isoform 1 [Ipomoea batatas]
MALLQEWVIMAAEAPSWADQWGAGGIGAMGEEDNTKAKEEGKKKEGSQGGLGKAKAVAMAGAQKVKNGTSMGIKWVKNKCQKKNNTSST